MSLSKLKAGDTVVVTGNTKSINKQQIRLLPLLALLFGLLKISCI
jgi:hypothetical protein